MSQSNILLSNSRRIATELQTRDQQEEHYQHYAPVPIGVAPLYAGRWLRSGVSEDFAVDGSVTPVGFGLTAEDGSILRVYRLRLTIEAATQPEWEDFADLPPLAEGLALAVLDSDLAAIVDLLDGGALQSNADIAAVFSSFAVTQLGTSYAMVATLDFPVPLRLDGGAGESLRLTVSDDLSALSRARLWVDAYDEGELR